MSRPSNILPPPACAPYDSSSPYFAYGYRPSLPAGIIFTTCFFAISATQLFYMIKYRAWWMFFIVVGAGLECLGWIGRLVAHYCVYSNVIDTMQVATLIMGPGWTQAGVYIALWVLVQLIGEGASPLNPKIYLWICVVVDTVCLSLQAIGGGLAGAAASDYEDPQTGTTVMVAGIIAQLVCGCVFFVLISIVYWRGRDQIRKRRGIMLAAGAIMFSTLMMNLRGFYRSVELIQGWTGYLITRERFIIGLDAIPMLLAMGGLAIFSPGPLLAKPRREQKRQIVKDQEANSREDFAREEADDSRRTLTTQEQNEAKIVEEI